MRALPAILSLILLANGAISAPRPNIILVLADDLGYGDVACNGNPIVRTPHVDRFSRDCVRFTDFHVSPTCSPTRAALMTGRHEFRSGVTHTILERERLSLKATTIAQMLKAQGYATGIFGKWHLGDEPAYQPDRRGFDEVFIHGGGGIGQTFPGSCGDAPGNTYFDPAILHNGRFEKTKGFCTDVFCSQALQWIDHQRQGGKPFFAYIPFNAPHGPLQCPEKYVEHYRGKVSEELAKYFGMIENIDNNFGLLEARLKEWHLDENTLLIFMGDNGSATGARFYNAGMRGSKGAPYNGGTRVASFWRWPGGFRGGVEVSSLTAHIDVFPTFAEMAGAKPSPDLKLDGRSLLPLLKNPNANWAERCLITHVGRWPTGKAAESRNSHCAVLGSRFHLVNNTELYDTKLDPGEAKNVFDDHPEVVADMRLAYDQWWGEVLPALENEDVIGPKLNPFKELYWKQFGGGPDADLLKKMDPMLKRESGGK